MWFILGSPKPKPIELRLKPSLSGGGTQDYITNNYDFDEYIELGNRVTIFSGDSSPMTIADISSGGLYVFFRADQATTNVNAFNVAGNSFARLRYSD